MEKTFQNSEIPIETIENKLNSRSCVMLRQGGLQNILSKTGFYCFNAIEKTCQNDIFAYKN